MLINLSGADQQFLADLERIKLKQDNAQRQLSSGLRINTPADAPDQISGLLQLRADLERNQQITTNLSQVKTEAAASEKALASAVQLMDTAKSLALQASGTAVTAETRLALAERARGLEQQMVATSQTTAGGRYVFSGDADTSAAYAWNSATLAVDRLSTAGGTRFIQHPSGTSFVAGKTAQEIFDKRDIHDNATPENAFVALHSLTVALTNNDADEIDDALKNLRTAGDYVNQQLSSYGTLQNRVDEAIDYGKQLGVRLTAELSERRDADVTGSILELTQATTEQQAALSARAQQPRGTLLDYLR
jgi:flagellar hook-associated protein 3 FlgL